MHRLSGEHALSTLCRVVRVNRSSYYKHYSSGKSARARENEEIRRCILLIYSSHSKRPGAYKIQHLLERESVPAYEGDESAEDVHGHKAEEQEDE